MNSILQLRLQISFIVFRRIFVSVRAALRGEDDAIFYFGNERTRSDSITMAKYHSNLSSTTRLPYIVFVKVKLYQEFR